MVDLLTDLGEEYFLETAMNGVTLTIGLYDSSTDSLGETSDIGDVTTEPDTGGDYARQTDTFNMADLSGNWGIQNANQITFNVSSNSQTVNAYMIIVSFQADDTGDGSSTTHLLAAGDLSQQRDLSQLDTLNLEANAVQATLD